MECWEVVPGFSKIAECLRAMLGDFSALVTGSWARGLLSDLDIIVFSERAEPKVSLCCWGDALPVRHNVRKALRR